MASALLVASYSYCYSETTYGVTNNAITNGLSWDMNNVLPDASLPWVSVEVNGLVYRYTINKDPSTGSTVYVRNKDPINGGYVFEERDDWKPGDSGGTVQKLFRFPYIDSTRWGDGSIDLEGSGVISDAIITYNYKMTVDDGKMLCSTSPLADPSCPGFAEALADLLASITELDPDDPFYDQWVQANINNDTDEDQYEDDEQIEEPEEEESNFEKESLAGKNTIEGIVDVDRQDAILQQLAQLPKIEPYYQKQIFGGIYEDTIKLIDTNIPDNGRALRSLASDSKHRDMVRSQYEQ